MDEKLAARNHPPDPGESQPSARARGESVLQLAPSHTRTFRGPRPGAVEADQRKPAPHPALPDDTRLWAALVQASGGVWGGCVYDVDAIVAQLARGAIRINQQLLQSEPATTEKVIR